MFTKIFLSGTQVICRTYISIPLLQNSLNLRARDSHSHFFVRIGYAYFSHPYYNNMKLAYCALAIMLKIFLSPSEALHIVHFRTITNEMKKMIQNAGNTTRMRAL